MTLQWKGKRHQPFLITRTSERVYGNGVTAKEVLKDNKVTASAAIRAFPNALGRYSSRTATE